MRTSDNIRAIEEAGADMIGLNFYEPSSRYVSEVPAYLPIRAKSVGVFVNAKIEEVIEKTARYQLDYIQLHGNESPVYCKEISLKTGKPVIKVFSISDSKEIANTYPYDQWCGLYIFDTKCDSFGGSGKTFDWSMLNEVPIHKPFLLSGGIGLEEVSQLQKFTHPQLAGYDINSKFETAPAVKDVERIKKFITLINNQL